MRLLPSASPAELLVGGFQIMRNANAGRFRSQTLLKSLTKKEVRSRRKAHSSSISYTRLGWRKCAQCAHDFSLRPRGTDQSVRHPSGEGLAPSYVPFL